MIKTTTQDGYPISIPTAFNRYKIIQNIGCGSTCSVFLVEDIMIKKYFSAKVISKIDAEKRKIVKSIENEVNILQKIGHPNIVKIEDFFEIKNKFEEEYYVIIMEYCENGDLISYITKKGFKCESEKKKIIKKCLEAIKYLHKKGISHGDIKSENILLDKNLSPKLCDFGFAKLTKTAGDEAKNGTLYYAAPELFLKGKFDTLKTDIYAIGITLYSMSELEFPFENDDQYTIIQQILNGKLSIRKGIDNKLCKLVEKCTSINPQNRPTIEEIINDDYFLCDNKNNNMFQSKINSYKNIEELEIHFFDI